jgi:hypothetical protein
MLTVEHELNTEIQPMSQVVGNSSKLSQDVVEAARPITAGEIGAEQCRQGL